MTTRAEDRATVGTDPSAVPGAKTEGRAENPLADSARSDQPPSGLAQSDKSLAATAASLRSVKASRWSGFPEQCSQNIRNAHLIMTLYSMITMIHR